MTNLSSARFFEHFFMGAPLNARIEKLARIQELIQQESFSDNDLGKKVILIALTVLSKPKIYLSSQEDLEKNLSQEFKRKLIKLHFPTAVIDVVLQKLKKIIQKVEVFDFDQSVSRDRVSPFDLDHERFGGANAGQLNKRYQQIHFIL